VTAVDVPAAAPRTLLDKLWDDHVLQSLGDGVDLLQIDRHLLHDLAGVISLEDMAERGIRTLRPELTIGALDHAVSTEPGRTADSSAISGRYVHAMRKLCADAAIPLVDLDDPGQGIVHVTAPEQGISLPGLSIVCGDSHTCTHGALGALAWGIGSSEVTHVLATQTVRQRRPASYRVWLDGVLPAGTDAKDVILYAIGRLGTGFGTGAAVEFAGEAVRAMSMDQRFVLCNMAIEMGAKFGLIAPDATTFAYLNGLPASPAGSDWDAAMAHWRALPSDAGAVFAQERHIDVAGIEPQITWGTNPGQGSAIGGRVPAIAGAADEAALGYMQLSPGTVLAGLPVDQVFIGSCAGGRLSDLREAAAILRGRKVAAHVSAWVVPGSAAVKAAAEAEGLHRVFLAAGASWRNSGCSMCVGSNGDTVAAGQRVVSTTNRNFVGRQGKGAMTHLASPATAAASAVLGRIADHRLLERL
jgi:3-isopropylmalate/(R)-2-methylmalate dehydratase large subunit